MWPKFKNNLLKHLCLKESWVIFFILGFVMMNYPFINIFNKYSMVLNVPVLFLYLLTGWVISIFVIWLYIKSVDACKENEREKEERR